MAINWDNGRYITLRAKDTATASKLDNTQLYAAIFYNEDQHDRSADVLVQWSNKPEDAQIVTIPGTTDDKGMAIVAFVDGSDTNGSISATVSSIEENAKLGAFLFSVSQPIDASWLTRNINVKEHIGEKLQITKFSRFYATLPTRRYILNLTSGKSQFIFMQMHRSKAVIYIINQTAEPAENIFKLGTTAPSNIKTNATTKSSLSVPFMGSPNQIVWMNADSVLNLENATILLQETSLLASDESDEEDAGSVNA